MRIDQLDIKIKFGNRIRENIESSSVISNASNTLLNTANIHYNYSHLHKHVVNSESALRVRACVRACMSMGGFTTQDLSEVVCACVHVCTIVLSLQDDLQVSRECAIYSVSVRTSLHAPRLCERVLRACQPASRGRAHEGQLLLEP